MRKAFEIGGVVAAAVLIAFGIVAIFMGFNGRSTVTDSLKQENIVGSPDMTPTAIKAEAAKAGLPSNISFPTMSVAGKKIDTGQEAHAFAGYMRIHALEATGGLTYAEMGRFVAKPGTPANQTDGNGGTSVEQYALVDPKTKQPVDNGARNVWVTRDRALDGAQQQLHGRPALALRSRGRDRAPAERHRLRDPRHRRSAPEPGMGLLLWAQAGACGRTNGRARLDGILRRTDDGPPSGGPSAVVRTRRAALRQARSARALPGSRGAASA